MFKTKAPVVPLTREQSIARHQRLAESELARAEKAGRIEAQTVHATRATAHATLAVSYLLGTDAPPPVEDDDDEGAPAGDGS